MYQTACRRKDTLSKEEQQMSPKRIDVHHHFLTPEYVEELAKVGVVEAGGVPLVQFERWEPEDSLAVMDSYGIETALLSVSSPGLCFGNAPKAREMARSLNEFAAACVRRLPGRFGFFAVLPLPDVEATLSEIGYALDTLGAAGVGLLSNHEGIYLGDPRFEEIFAELDRRAAVAFIHPTVFTSSEIPSAHNAGSPVPTIQGSVLEFVFDTTRAVANLISSGTLKRYPNVRIILSHAGGAVPLFADRLIDRSEIVALVREVQAGRAAPPSLETLERMMRAVTEDAFELLRGLYYDTALSANPTVLGALQRLVPASRVLLGTDFPFAQEIGVRYSLDGLAAYEGFGEEERAMIDSGTALTLFPCLRPSASR
jgi:predicted TIM-barrel fold metal-dependent hydrolase